MLIHAQQQQHTQSVSIHLKWQMGLSLSEINRGPLLKRFGSEVKSSKKLPKSIFSYVWKNSSSSCQPASSQAQCRVILLFPRRLSTFCVGLRRAIKRFKTMLIRLWHQTPAGFKSPCSSSWEQYSDFKVCLIFVRATAGSAVELQGKLHTRAEWSILNFSALLLGLI